MAKKKSTPKSKSKVEEPKVLTNKDRQKTVDKLNKLRGTQVMELPDDAIVNIPISGSFNKALEGLFFYLMDDMNAADILFSMNQIQKQFKDIPSETISDKTKALWAVLTLLSEIHYQSDAQDKLVKKDQKVGNLLHDFFHGVTGTKEVLAANLGKLQEMKEKEGKDLTED